MVMQESKTKSKLSGINYNGDSGALQVSASSASLSLESILSLKRLQHPDKSW